MQMQQKICQKNYPEAFLLACAFPDTTKIMDYFQERMHDFSIDHIIIVLNKDDQEELCQQRSKRRRKTALFGNVNLGSYCWSHSWPWRITWWKDQ